MKRDIGLYLDDILESINRIEDYTSGISEKEFNENIEIQDAVVRRFEIIGEAVKSIPTDFRNNYPKVPWKKIAGMRDILSHAYFQIKLERVWAAIKIDLPGLKKVLEKLPEVTKN